jgi:hypothetical protein
MANHVYIKIESQGNSPKAAENAELISKAFYQLNTSGADRASNIVFGWVEHPDGRQNEVMMHVDLDYKLYCREKGGLGTLNAWCRQNMTPAEAQEKVDFITNGEEGMFVTVEHFLPDSFQFYTREDLINDGWIVEDEL